MCVCDVSDSDPVQVEKPRRKPVVEEFEEDFYHGLYDDDIPVSSVTVGPNITEYEVRHREKEEEKRGKQKINAAVSNGCAVV